MTVYAAASHAQQHPQIGAGVLALVLLAAAVAYVIACVIWPFAACRRCDGAGKHRSPSGKAWRTCKRCRGTGARIRIGRKAWTALTKRHDAAAKADDAAKKFGR